MKILWLVPPSPYKGNPNIAQYRFFKVMEGNYSVIYPYLIAMGCTELKQAGFDIDFLDCPTERIGSIEQIALGKYDVVVMELRTPIAYHIYAMARKIWKEGAQVILYGDHATAFPNEARDNCDYVMAGGDYDVGITNLCHAINQGLTIHNRVYESSLVQDLNLLPLADRELVNWQNYGEAWKHRKAFLWTMSARGCHVNAENGGCTFCAWAGCMWKNRVRFRSPSNVADEYAFLQRRHGSLEILDDADCFIQHWGKLFASDLISRGFRKDDILWAVQTIPTEVTDLDSWKLMRKSGLLTVKLGIESLNQYTLDKVGKHLTVRQVEKSFEILKAAKINIHANMMVGFPWETKDDAYRTIKAIKKLDPNQAQFSFLIPYPWTKMYHEARENGWFLLDPKDWSNYDATRPILKMEGLTPEEIVDLYKANWSEFYLNWKYIARKTLKAIGHSIAEFNLDDMRQLWRGYKSVTKGHMKSMSAGKKNDDA